MPLPASGLLPLIDKEFLMKLELGFFIPPVPPEPFVDMALAAERFGFDFVTTDDHIIDPFGPSAADNDGVYGTNESWTAMSFVAGATSRISVSHMVLVAAFRGPGMLAKMATTLDQFSKGRMDLTVGAGWFEREFNSFGYAWEDHKGRLEREREIVEILRGLWTRPRFSYDGKYYTIKDAEITPKPFQKPTPPLWIGGDSKRSMQLAADLGDGWLVHGHQPGEIGSMFSRIVPLLGDKAESFGLGMAVFVVMASDPEEATRKVERIIPPEVMAQYQQAGIRHELNNRISGSAQQCLDTIREYRKTGLNRLITIFIDPEDAARFAEEVLPELRKD